MGNPVNMTEMIAVFEAIRASFPHLKMRLERDHPHVDLSMDIPRQRGLAFDVSLNLQGDKLHLSAGACWLEWFPCTSADVVARFREAVQGVLSGNFRIVEHCRLGWPVKAELQRPQLDSWQTIGTWSRLYLPFGMKTTRVLQNAGGTDAV